MPFDWIKMYSSIWRLRGTLIIAATNWSVAPLAPLLGLWTLSRTLTKTVFPLSSRVRQSPQWPGEILMNSSQMSDFYLSLKQWHFHRNGKKRTTKCFMAKRVQCGERLRATVQVFLHSHEKFSPNQMHAFWKVARIHILCRLIKERFRKCRDCGYLKENKTQEQNTF